MSQGVPTMPEFIPLKRAQSHAPQVSCDARRRSNAITRDYRLAALEKSEATLLQFTTFHHAAT